MNPFMSAVLGRRCAPPPETWRVKCHYVQMCMVMTHSVVATHAHLIRGNPFGIAVGEAFFFFLFFLSPSPVANYAQRKGVKLMLHMATIECV